MEHPSSSSKKMEQSWIRLREIEMIDPTPLPPWRPEVFSKIEIEPDREAAIEKAEATRSISDVVIYSDASGRQGHLGAAAAAIDEMQQTTDSVQIQVGSMDRWSVHAVELIGILYAINIINLVAVRRWTTSHSWVRSATILSDSILFTPFSKQPRTPRPMAQRFDYNGYLVTAGYPEMTLPTG
ncbi:hypothetical protein CBS147333_9748 [Penicillium roqueforti]|nr:hypothetical protein DTO013F2_10127 [Penicillium roqueforti]KAI3095575.1 hypothetical protein CBS147333_9748 [Penicillium roqueforti]KAI3189750.1 hypothetical protein CBS147311_9869 [Penicillium roqueforti]KAI3261097.1 hypothetical protein CBS147308_10049 [Penicillium roqueforti]KAI3277398.1 hypothetical protein DTO003C3_10091 [Penicillium roqueforti]